MSQHGLATPWRLEPSTNTNTNTTTITNTNTSTCINFTVVDCDFFFMFSAVDEPPPASMEAHKTGDVVLRRTLI